MKRILPFYTYLLSSILFLSLSSFTVEPSFDTDYENDSKAEKIMTKEFNVGTNAVLDIENSYGNVKISPWNSNKIRVDVYVKLNSNVANVRDYALKNFKVNINQQGNSVVIRTNHLKNEIKHTLNYVIYAPASVSAKLKVEYGDVALGNLNGFVDVNLEYGDLYAEKLGFGSAEKANSIKSAYGDVAIKEAAWLNLTIEYGDFALQSGYAIGVNGSYSDFKFDKIKFINAALSYSDLKVGSLNSIKGKLINTDIKVDKLFDNMILNLSYSNVIVYSIDSGFKNIELQGIYSDGKLTFQNDASFKLNVTSKNSDFKLYNLQGGSQSYENSFSKVIGSNPNKNVRISCTYGDWTLRKN